MPVDAKNIERIVELITRQVLLALAEDERAAAGTEANPCSQECGSGYCVRHCPDKVELIVQAGAERISAGIGAVAVQPGLSRYIDHTLLKSRDYELVARDIRAVVRVSHAHTPAALVKVIIEAALLNEEEKIAASLLAKEAGADYVKTSTGFASGGATVADVALMRRTVGPAMGVKAAGGVRDRADAEAMIKAGATRLGASAGVKIIQTTGPEPAAPAPAREGKY